MSRTYFLTTPRVGFAVWRAEDLELARLLWGNPRVARYICAAGVFTEEEIAARLAREIQTREKDGVQYWPIFRRRTGEFLGCCGLRSRSAGEYELGFHLRPDAWGQGLAPEAAEAVIGYAFSALGAKRLFAGHHPDNAASRRVLEKLGFQPVGEEFYPPTGRNHPSYERLPDTGDGEAPPSATHRAAFSNSR